MRWIGHGFVNASHVATVKNDTGRTGVNQAGDAVVTASRQYIGRAKDIGAIIGAVATADAGLGRDVEHDVAARRGTGDG